MKTGRPKNIPIKDIRRDPELQCRCGLTEQVIVDYAEAIARGEKLPAVTLYEDKAGALWLSDGFHRIAAYERAGKTEAPAQVMEGERSDAAWAGLAANKTNGLRMTNADKERAVKLALALAPQHSDRMIADHLGVGHPLVAKYRAQSGGRNSTSADAADRREGRDGKTYPASRERQAPLPPIDDDPPPSITDDAPPTVATDDLPPEISDSPPAVEEQPRDLAGNEITRPEIAEAFRRTPELNDLCTTISRVKTTVLSRLQAKDPLYARYVGESTFEADANNFRRHIDHCKPYAICPHCKQSGKRGTRTCTACSGAGWLNKTDWELVPADLRAALKTA